MSYQSPHLRNAASKKPMPGKEPAGGGAVKSKEGNAAVEPKPQSQEHGTQPHPVTGVHSVAVHHMGGGRFKSQTHHDGGQVEERDHQGEQEVQQHVAESFPSEQRDPMQDNDDEGMPIDGLGPSA